MKAKITQIHPQTSGLYQITFDFDTHVVRASIEAAGLLDPKIVQATIKFACQKYKEDLQRNQIINELIGKEIEVE